MTDKERMEITMIAMIYGDMLEANDPEKDEYFEALISLVQKGRIVAFYDDDEGVVKYQAIQGG